MKTSELTGTALDWAVAKCEGKNGVLHDDGITRCIVVAAPSGVYKGTYRPSINWAQGGPIIEREQIETICNGMQPDGLQWVARTQAEKWTYDPLESGPTPLIAAMRCYVASKLGEEVEVPQELI
jgi:hypothetical protein